MAGLPHSTRRALPILLLASMLSCSLFFLPSLHGDSPAGPPDPVPLKRVRLTPDQLPREMDRAKQGVLVKLPEESFEALVRQAALAEASRKNPPRLIEAHYHAELSDGALVGSCQWKLVHNVPAPGLLSLTPLNLALRQPRFENGDAYIADFNGRDPSLLVESAGDHSASAEWSARAESRPEGLQFDLRFPSCPVAVMELDLPADKIAVVDDGDLSGPRPAGTASLNRWTIACGGRSQIGLRICSRSQPPVVRAALVTTQVLSPEGQQANYAFSLKSLHQGVRDLTFECDSALRPYQVNAPGLEKWELAPAAASPTVVLNVHLLRPLEEGTVQILCHAPLTGSEPNVWTSPAVRLRQSLPAGETLNVAIQPGLHVTTLEPGAFRLRETALDQQPGSPSGPRQLTFTGGGVQESDAAGGRPRAKLTPHDAVFRARQLAWWRVDPPRSALTLQVVYDVSYGRLFRLAERLPQGWEVQAVTLAPEHLMRNWRIRPEKEGPLLLVDLQSPLTSTDKPPPQKPVLTVRLTPAQKPEYGKELAFPNAYPVGALFREGALAISFDERADQLALKTAAVEAPPDEDGPWEKDYPARYYPYRTLPADARPAVPGVLTLRARPPQVRAQCTNDVILSSGKATVEVHLRLEAEQGSVDSVDLWASAPYVSAASGDPWGWRAERGGVEVRETRRMPAIEAAAAAGVVTAPGSLAAAAFLVGQPRGECWRLTFARPLRVGEPILLHAAITAKTDEERHEVPLTTVLGVSQMEGEATLRLAAAHPLQVEAFGLREASPEFSNHPRGATAWRIFRYNGPAVGLTLVGRLEDADRATEAAVDRAALTTYVGADGVLEHHFFFNVTHWQQRFLPLQLPPGAHFLTYQVDGVWSPRPAAVDDASGNAIINLAAPTRLSPAENPSMHWYEVVYTTTAQLGWLWTSVNAPAPSLPVRPAVFQRTWRLAPEFSPLDSQVLRLPGPGEGTEAAREPNKPEDLWGASRFRGPSSLTWFQGRDEMMRREALSDALVGLRGKTEQTRLLGQVLVDAAGALEKTGQSLVIDAEALNDASVAPDAGVVVKAQSAEDAAAPWDDIGLTALRTPSGWLLTTRRQSEAWREQRGAAVPSDEIEKAAADAARWGRDASGRFQVAAFWLDAKLKKLSSLPSPQAALMQWTEWAPPAAPAEAGTLLLVRPPLMEAVGWVATTLFGLLFLAIAWRWKRLGPGLLLTWLAASGLGLVWLPTGLQRLTWPALLAGCVFALGWRLWSGAGTIKPKAGLNLQKSAARAAAGAGALLLAYGLAAWGRAADSAPPAATPATIFVAPGAADSPDKHFVLAPPQLLEKLHTLTRPADAPAAVLLKADYTGKVVEGVAEFDAVFSVYCFSDDATPLTLPLDGIQVNGDVLLDGAPVQATALQNSQPGFAIPVKGRTKPGDAPHKVEFHFRTSVTGPTGERNIQFTVPRLAESHLLLRLPKGSTYILALVKYGVQKPAPDGDPCSLDVELGRVAAPLHFRWVGDNPNGQPPLPVIALKEAYLWDLRLESSNLTAFLSYSISSGATASLGVKTPPELDVTAVAAHRPHESAPLRLRGWKVVGAGPARTLEMEFLFPVNGDVELLLEMAPRSPWPPSFTLPLPSPILPPSQPGGKPGRAVVSFLAYRAEGLQVDRVNPVGVTGIRPEEFAPFWPRSTWTDPRPPSYASTILREDENHPPVLGLKVRPSSPAAHAEVGMTVHVGPRQADVRATAVLTPRGDDPSLVQWQIRSAQPFTVTGVTGPNVRTWSQQGDQVLAWVEPPIKAEGKRGELPSLQLTGWTPLSGGPEATRFELPDLRVACADSQDTTVRLIAGNEVSLTEASLHNLTAIDPMGPANVYAAGGKIDYGGVWQVHSDPAQVHILTLTGMRDRKLTFTAVVDCQPAHGNVQSLAVRVRNWMGPVRLESTAALSQRVQQRDPADRIWLLDQDQSAAEPLRITLTGEQPIDPAAGAAAPDVTVFGAAIVERWTAVTGSNLTAEPSGGLTPVENASKEQPRLQNLLSGAKERPQAAGSIWKITSPEWRLNLTVRDPATAAAPVEIFLADYETVAGSGGRWLHRAEYWLHHEPNTDFNLTFPADAEVLSVTMEGVETAPLQTNPRALWMPLTGRPAFCRVRLRWRYGTEDMKRPNLDGPVLQGARDNTAVWTVLVPPGWEAETLGGKNGLRSGLAQAASLSWQRAAAQFSISAALAQRSADGAGAAALAEAQRRFYIECRRARLRLEAVPVDTSGAWPVGRAPLEALSDLLQKNKDLADKRRFEPIRAKAEQQAEAKGSLPSEGSLDEGMGRLLYAVRDAGEPAPELALRPSQFDRLLNAWRLSWMWTGLLLLAALLSLFRPAWVWLRFFWPEQIGLVGLAGWWAAGATWVVLALLALALSARLWIILLAAGRVFRRPPPDKPKTTTNLPAIS